MATNQYKDFTIINDVNLLKPGHFRLGEMILCNQDHGIYFQLVDKIKRYGGFDVRDHLESTENDNPLSANMGRMLNLFINESNSLFANAIQLIDLNIEKLDFDYSNTEDRLTKLENETQLYPELFQYHDLQINGINKNSSKLMDDFINIVSLYDVKLDSINSDINDIKNKEEESYEYFQSLIQNIPEALQQYDIVIELLKHILNDNRKDIINIIQLIDINNLDITKTLKRDIEELQNQIQNQ